MPLLELKNIKKYFPVRKGIFSRIYRYLKAVDGVSFSIEHGESFGLVGESGCGKSTLGRAILLLEQPNEGIIKFNERIIFNSKSNFRITKDQLHYFRRKAQIIFQDPYSSLNPRKTVLSTLKEGLIIHKLAKPNEYTEIVAFLLKSVGLSPDIMYRYPHEFSGGQRQRIGIARAISINPEFIVADEPVSALDISVRGQIINLLRDIQDKHSLAFLFIAHDINLVRYFSKRIAVMYLGIIVETADSDILVEHPLHPYTEALIESTPSTDPEKRDIDKILLGDVPDLRKMPNGCLFHPRCPKKKKICEEQRPLLEEKKSGHFVACFMV